MPIDPSVEALVREISAKLGGLEQTVNAKFEGLNQRVTGLSADAREARDAAIKTTERVEAQNIPAAIASIKGEMDKRFERAASDLINSYDKIRRDQIATSTDIDRRLVALEAFKSKAEGAGGVIGWIAKNLNWLLPILFAGALAVGLHEKIH